MTFNANYTLQFADGTGSSSTTAADLVNEGFKNFNLAGNFQKRTKCAARLLDRLEYY